MWNNLELLKHSFAAALVGLGLGTAAVGCGAGTRSPADTVTFNRDIAPIVFEHCAACHRPGESTPFGLLTYDEVRSMAPAVVAATEARRMPPWLPEAGRGEFADDRRLSDEEMLQIRRWVEQGAIQGDSADLPSAPIPREGWWLGEPDLVVEMPAPYMLEAGGGDVFRNFVIPVSISGSRYVRAVELQPTNPKVVHHAVMMTDRTSASRRLERQDTGPGFDGMFAASEAQSPDGFILGWTPGKIPHEGFDGLAWRLVPGTDLVVQMHLRPIGTREAVGARVGFYFADAEPDRYPYLLTLGSQTIDIPPGVAEYTVRDEYVLPVDVEVLSVYPHAHYIGKEMQAFARLPDGSVEWLLHITDWDFNWQDEYRYAAPVLLPKGTAVVMEFTYDNSAANPRNPNTPPRRVVYGPESTDEMGNLFLQVLPQTSDDFATLNRSFALKYLDGQIEGFEHLLRLEPNDPLWRNGLGNALRLRGDLDRAIAEYRAALAAKPDYAQARYNLGAALQARGDAAQAIEQYRQALALDPDDPSTHYNLANTLQSLGRLDESAAEYRRVIAIEPGHANAHNNLGNTYRVLGRLQDAMTHYQLALDVAPNHADANNNLGNLLASQGHLDSAVGHFERAIATNPNFAQAHYNLGSTLNLMNRIPEGVEAFRRAVRLEPNWPVPLFGLAWILATHPDRSLRNPREAVVFAERAARLTENRHPAVLDALAAAYAANDEFERASDVAARAVQLANAAEQDDLARAINERLALYRQGRPYRFRTTDRAGVPE